MNRVGEREVEVMSRQAKFWLLMVTVSALVLMWVIMSADSAAAQEYAEAPEPPGVMNAPTGPECERYGCLYGHERGCHYTRGGEGGGCGVVDHGIAHEPLMDGQGVTSEYPNGRHFIRVLWPDRYDPARRAAWDRLAQCESTGDWYINTGNGYYGGVQFSLSSWRAAGGQQYAAYPHHAWPAQQIATAEVLLSMQGRGAWPGCLRKGMGAPYPQ